MSTPRRNRSAIFQCLLIAWLSSSIVAGQSPEIRPPSPDASTESLPPVPAPSPYRQPSIRKITFKHAKAGDVLKILQQLEPEQKGASGFAVDERTNSFIFQPEDDQTARIFEELCTLPDAETPTPGDTGNGVSISVPAFGPKPLAFDFSNGIVRGESVESLRQQYNEIEQQTHQLADKLRQARLPNESQRSELQAAVRKSFEALRDADCESRRDSPA